jgi:hypothetical protein
VRYGDFEGIIVAIKKQSLGSAGSAARCLTCSTTTNATPIVATFGASHGLKSGDIVALAGITGNTAANGVWQLVFTAATTAQLIIPRAISSAWFGPVSTATARGDFSTIRL